MYNGSSQGGDPPSPPEGGGGGGKQEVCQVKVGMTSAGEQVPCQVCAKIEKRFLRFFLTVFRFCERKSRLTPKKSKKKSTKDVDGWRSGDYAIRMKIENEIKWSDLVDIEVCGGTSTVAYVTSAFSKVLNRELTEDECELVTNKFAVEMYEMEFNRKY